MSQGLGDLLVRDRIITPTQLERALKAQKESGGPRRLGSTLVRLRKIASFCEDKVDAATKNMLALLEAIVIGFLGVVVVGVVISRSLPLFLMDLQAFELGTVARRRRASADG